MELKINKKGVFFSLIAIFMSSLFILLFSSIFHVPLNLQAHNDLENLNQINSLVGDLGEFVDSVSSVASFLVLNDLSDKSPILDSETNFISCYLNNTFLNKTHSLTNCSSENHSFGAIFETFLSKAKQAYNLDLNYSIINVTFSQKNPYVCVVNTILVLNISYLDASWSRLINSSQEISLVGIKDPITTGSTFERNISLAPISFSASFHNTDFNGNYSLVKQFIKGGFYFLDSNAPSFLDALEGNYTINSPFGIASFVPDNISYLGNTSSYLSYEWKNNSIFNSTKLKRINVSGLNNSFALSDNYLSIMNSYNNSCPASINPELLKVRGCCDSSGCDPSCGFISTCS